MKIVTNVLSNEIQYNYDDAGKVFDKFFRFEIFTGENGREKLKWKASWEKEAHSPYR